MNTYSLKERIWQAINRQAWLDRLAGSVFGFVNRLYAGSGVSQGVENFLNGTWLGHPLHPAITDVPVGSWTAAVVLDGIEVSSRKKRFGRAADTAVLIGVVSAAAAAVAGFTDAQHYREEKGRFAILHALLNTVGLGLFTASYVARRNKNRPLGRGLALGGYLLAFSSAYIGGDMVFRQRIGVNHSLKKAEVNEFTAVLPEYELADGRLTRVEVKGVPVLLLRRGEHVFAVNEICPHMGGPLSRGELRVDDTVVCPLHGSRFDLHTGNIIDGPSAYPVPCYDARLNNGQVEIRLHDRYRQEEIPGVQVRGEVSRSYID
ncbi:MAG TPA: Rieske 2Fe-2S domain-containing protein [Anaerolineaceae bacterium]|nr:Rieske 2Fe-2S domain-containing protein [Anaerolineaceae bacterium]